MPLPLDEGFLEIGHGVDDQLHEPAVEDPRLLPDAVIFEHVAELPLAVRAGGADVLLHLRPRDVLEGLEDLLHLHPAGDGGAPVGEVRRLA